MSVDLPEEQRLMAEELGVLKYETITADVNSKLRWPWETDNKYGTFVRKSSRGSRSVIRFREKVQPGGAQHAIPTPPAKKITFLYLRDRLRIQAFDGEREVKLGNADIPYNHPDFNEILWELMHRAASRLGRLLNV